MINEHSCIVCEQTLENRRPQTRTCSGACRTKLHRMKQTRPISLKLVLSKVQFDSLKHQADNLGVMLNHLVISRAIQPLATAGGQL